MLCGERLNTQLFPRRTPLFVPVSDFALARENPDKCHLLGTRAQAITLGEMSGREENMRVDAGSIFKM